MQYVTINLAILRQKIRSSIHAKRFLKRILRMQFLSFSVIGNLTNFVKDVCSNIPLAVIIVEIVDIIGKVDVVDAVEVVHVGNVVDGDDTADGVDVNQATAQGETPLYVAAQKGHAEIVTLLLAAAGACEQPVVAGQHEHQLVRVAVLQGEHNVLGIKKSTVIYDANQSV